jgi:hypothetical protein
MPPKFRPGSYLDRVHDPPFHVPGTYIDLDLDIFVHDEFDEYMSDVEFARVAQANRFNFLRFSMLAITAHREVQRQLELTTASD